MNITDVMNGIVSNKIDIEKCQQLIHQFNKLNKTNYFIRVLNVNNTELVGTSDFNTNRINITLVNAIPDKSDIGYSSGYITAYDIG